MATTDASSTNENDKSEVSARSLVNTTPLNATEERNRRSISRLNMTDETCESVVFIWFDSKEPSSTNIVAALRAINNHVKTFTDPTICIDAIKSTKEKVFFICSVTKNELISAVHDLAAVEAIFLLISGGESVKAEFPKLFGTFTQQEELLRAVKEVLSTFEQIRLEEFSFEQDEIFLWSQIWKEDLINRRAASNKLSMIELAREFYRDNSRIVETIGELENSYRPADALNWCFRFPFPARFILHALRAHSRSQLNVVRFLYVDVARSFQQNSKHKSSAQVYRGMKLSNELLDRFESNVGQLMCTSGFFPCVKSRTNALKLASLPNYRPDLQSVLFKIDCDSSSPYTELSIKNAPSQFVFDVCTAFRVVHVNRGQMSIIKLKTAGDAGKRVAIYYLSNHPEETACAVLDGLLTTVRDPIPSAQAPALSSKQPTSPRASIPSLKPVSTSTNSEITAQELTARKYAEEGDVDQALITYQQIQAPTVRVFIAMGELCADRKGDYDFALKCYKQALKLQEEAGEDISETLTCLGNVYQSRNEFDLALEHHRRALELRQSNRKSAPTAIISNLAGIANAHLSRGEYSEAIANGERALKLQQSLVPPNQISIASNLALLGNIYHRSGNSAHGIDLCTKALAIFERASPDDSPRLAELLYKLGEIQSNSGALLDAQRNLERSLKIYKTLLPRGHPDRTSVENELRHVIRLRREHLQQSASYC